MDHAQGDSSLITRAKTGDTQAYGALVERHQAVAFRVAFLVTRSAHDAEESTQDGFVKAWKALDRFQEGAPFAPWLLHIVRNEALNRVRSRSRRNRMRLRVEQQPTPLAPTAESEALRVLDSDTLGAAVDRLSRNLREVICCLYLLGFSEAETAAILRIPRGTVKSRAARARDVLAKDVLANDLEVGA